MANNSSGKVSNQIIYGIILIFIGVLFLLDNLNLFTMRHIWHYWPLILVVIGGMKVMEQGDAGSKRTGWIMLVIGLVLFAGALGLFQLTLKLLFPCILIGVGIMILTRPQGEKPQPPAVEQAGQTSQGQAGPTVTLNKDRDGDRDRDGSAAGDGEDPLNITAIMGGYQRSVTTRNFRGGEITAIMGGCELDLRQASFQGEVVINVFVIMGGIAIKVPNDWIVILQGTPLLGGFDERTTPPANGNKRLIIRGTAVMGGVEVRN